MDADESNSEDQRSLMSVEDLIDVHICGACKSQFHDVSLFISHKQQCPARLQLLRQAQAPSAAKSTRQTQTQTPPGDQQTNESRSLDFQSSVKQLEEETDEQNSKYPSTQSELFESEAAVQTSKRQCGMEGMLDEPSQTTTEVHSADVQPPVIAIGLGDTGQPILTFDTGHAEKAGPTTSTADEEKDITEGDTGLAHNINQISMGGSFGETDDQFVSGHNTHQSVTQGSPVARQGTTLSQVDVGQTGQADVGILHVSNGAAISQASTGGGPIFSQVSMGGMHSVGQISVEGVSSLNQGSTGGATSVNQVQMGGVTSVIGSSSQATGSQYSLVLGSNVLQRNPELGTEVTINQDYGVPFQTQYIRAGTSLLQTQSDGQTSPIKTVSTQVLQSIRSPKKQYTVPVKRFACEYSGCKFITAYMKDLERHVRIHTGERPFVCPYCAKSFNRGDKLKVHIRSHTGKKPYQCELCPYATTDNSSLKKHMRTHTGERPFKCQICQYASRNSSQLVVHLRTHTGDTPFQCHHCNASFKINSDLKRHIRLHTGEKPYQCEYCDYRCAIKGNLKTHYKINHSAENMVQCLHCDFKTSSSKAMRDHVKKHEESQKLFVCNTCDYTCKSSATLRIHKRVHSEEKPYKCTFCPYTSRQSGNVRTHIKRKHPEMLRTGIGVKKPVIRKFDKVVEASQKDASRNRLRPVCKKPFECNLCDAAFVREDSLKSHMRHHKVVDKQIAETVENAAWAVLQLHHKQLHQTPPAGGASSGEPNQDNSAVSISQEVSPNTGEPQSSAQAAYPRVTQGQGQVIQDSQPAAAATHSVRPQQGQATSSTSLQAGIRPATVQNIGGNLHQAPVKTPMQLQQAANSLLAFVQNNQNQAIEDNMQNIAISAARALTASKGSISTTNANAITITHEPMSKSQLNQMHINMVYRMPSTMVSISSPTGQQQRQAGNQPQVIGQPMDTQQQQQQATQVSQQLQHPHFSGQEHQQSQQQSQEVNSSSLKQTATMGVPAVSMTSLAGNLTTSDPQNVLHYKTAGQQQGTSMPVNILDLQGAAPISVQVLPAGIPHSAAGAQVLTKGAGATAAHGLSQSLQVILPASALANQAGLGAMFAGGTMQVAPSGGYPPQVILQVPANKDGHAVGVAQPGGIAASSVSHKDPTDSTPVQQTPATTLPSGDNVTNQRQTTMNTMDFAHLQPTTQVNTDEKSRETEN